MRSRVQGGSVFRLVLVAAVVVGCGGGTLDSNDGSTTGGTSQPLTVTAHEERSNTSPGSSEGVAPVPKAATSTVVLFEGLTYECEDGAISEWDCTHGVDAIYCSGRSGPYECSELWYPTELDSIRLVTFEGREYACALYESPCVAYTGGPLPSSFYTPDIWCDDGVCAEYDPDVWFEFTFDFNDYICESALSGLQSFDCYLWDGTTPMPAVQPDAYCSGPQSFLNCSDLWYPDDLDQYEMISFGGGDYICESALLGSYGDYDCGLYYGGDPGRVFTGELKCTDLGYNFECDYEYYPSELDGLTITHIGTSEYVCQDSYGGSECFIFYSGSPAHATLGLPDLYCNYSGLCDPYGYP